MKVITATNGPVLVTVTLYGEVSDKRLQQESAVAAHRADQLAPPVPKARKESHEDDPLDRYLQEVSRGW